MVFIHVQVEEKCDDERVPLTELRAASTRDLVKIKRFLRENGLPHLGVDGWIANFVMVEDEKGNCVGVAGLELYDTSGLLRSVAVDKDSRGRGHGRTLVNAILANARAKGVKNIYLLTDDAHDYFRRLGFQVVDRKDVDAPVKTSVEFTEACSESALVMRRVLS
jgi:amino-acid N-acetyltransferase